MYSVAVSAKGAAFEAAVPQGFMRSFGNNSPHAGGDYQIYGLSADAKRIVLGQIGCLFVQ